MTAPSAATRHRPTGQAPNLSAMSPVPEVVTVHLWGVRRRSIPGSLLAMGRDRPSLRRQPGLTFGKLLGTGSGETFMPQEADLGHWGVLACWNTTAAATGFETSGLLRRWRVRSHELLRLELRPLTSKGRWAGEQPFGVPGPQPYDGPVAVITRARIKPRLWRTFWGEVPPVSSTLRACPGLLLRLGIGEAPVGLQGTFSVWRSAAELNDFAYRRAEHAAVIARTRQLDWYAEELFARFAVLSSSGTYAGTPVRVPPT
jgi:hypothetical protein